MKFRILISLLLASLDIVWKNHFLFAIFILILSILSLQYVIIIIMTWKAHIFLSYCLQLWFSKTHVTMCISPLLLHYSKKCWYLFVRYGITCIRSWKPLPCSFWPQSNTKNLGTISYFMINCCILSSTFKCTLYSPDYKIFYFH